MNIIEVSDPKTIKGFHRVARKIHRRHENWVCPLENEIEGIFDPDINESFLHGDARRWVLMTRRKLIGRIAAFIDYDKCNVGQVTTGGIGFFECINSQEAANILFDIAKQWLFSRGMEAMEGPVNFGVNDNWWGLLVKGFEYKPVIGMQYHPPYYQKLFENYGFKKYFEQYSYQLHFRTDFPDRFWKIALWVINKGEYTFDHFRKENKVKYLEDIVKIYNKTWPSFKKDFTPLQYEEISNMYEKVKDIADEKFCWFAYHKGEPVGMLLMYPDINQVLCHLNGRLNILKKVYCWWLMRRKTITNARIVIMGVAPQYQNSGLESAIFWHLNEVLKTKPEYQTVELAWVGDFNQKDEKDV